MIPHDSPDSDAEFRALVEHSPVGLYIMDGRRFVYVNPRFAEILGYSRDELLYEVPVIETIAPEDRQRFAPPEPLHEDHNGMRTHFEFRGVRKDGALVDLEAYGAIVGVAGRPMIIGAVSDIGEQKRAKRALEESEQKFRMLAESAAAAIGIIQGRHFVYVNPYLQAASGYSCEELMSIDVADLVHPEDRAMVMDRLRRRLLGEEVAGYYEYRMVTKTGAVRWLEISPARIDYQGQPAVVGIAYDVTQRKEATEALRCSEEKYRELVEDVSDWVWAVDAQGRYTYSSPAVERILGYTPEEVIGLTPFDLMPPDERGSISEIFEHAVESRKEISNILNRNVRKDGEVRYLETSGRPVFDGQGRLVGYRGVDRDVTDRVLSAQAIRKSEARFRAIFEDAPAAIMIVDTSGIILSINSGFEQLTGRRKDQVVGHSVYDAVTNPMEMEQALEVTRRVASGESFQNLMWKPVRPDGQEMCILTNIVPLYNDQGKVEAILSIGTDITDRQLAEERARELEEQKRDFYRRTIMAATEGKLIITEGDQICEQCGECLGVWKLERGEQLRSIREEIGRQAEVAGMDKERVYDLVLCAGEALTNAIKHANGGDASLHRSEDLLCFVVSDHGPGIEALALPEVALKRGYSTAVSLGMGYKTMISIADKVYLATGPEGTTVGVEMSLYPSQEIYAAAGLPDTWRTKF